MDEIGKKYRARADRELQKRLDEFAEKLGVTYDQSATEKPDEHSVPSNLVLPDKTHNRPKQISASDSPSVIHTGHRERLRANVLHDPKLSGFSDVEILETLLSYVVPQRDTNVIAHKLLDKFGSLVGVMTADADALFAVKGMTGGAAQLLPGLWHACMGGNSLDVIIRTRCDAVNFFGSMYLGGVPDGLCIAYIADNNRLISFEHVNVAPDESYRACIGSVIKYGAAGVLPVWFGRETIGIGCDAVRYVGDLAAALDTVGATLCDFIMLTDYGYYTPGPRIKDYGGWVPQYVFIPERNFVRSTRAFEMAHTTDDDPIDPIGPRLLSAYINRHYKKD